MGTGNDSSKLTGADALELGLDELQRLLESGRRAEILTRLSRGGTAPRVLGALREPMRSHRFSADDGGEPIVRWIRPLERLTEEDGFHVLSDWDGQLEKLNPEIIPIDVLDFLLRPDVSDRLETPETTAAIALDYYFLYVLALLAMRVWDGDPDRALDRLDGLVSALQGPNGSGHRFIASAHSLILLATSHFEPDEDAFVRLRERLATLETSHRLELALAIAPIMSSHLRFGYQATYARDLVAMRKDNAPDYPWLMFALVELMRCWAEGAGSRHDETDRIDPRVTDALINGLTPDPKAFLGRAPASLTAFQDQVDAFQELVHRHRAALSSGARAYEPVAERYSPIAFFFNFPHNLLKAIVVDAASRGKPGDIALNDLLTGISRGPAFDEERQRLVEILMGYAKASPDTIRGRPTPVIVYDVRRGRRAFSDAMKILDGLNDSGA